MSLKNINVLFIDDEEEILELYRFFMGRFVGKVFTAGNTLQAEDILLQNPDISVVLSDIHMPQENGISFYERLKKQRKDLPAWLLCSADASPEIIDKAVKLGIRDVLQKPVRKEDILYALNRVFSEKDDPLREIMSTIQSITGVMLGPEKKLLVETRLMRRLRSLGLNRIEEYFDYFRNHKESEIQELVSLMTTHTTEFFREIGHFNYLNSVVFPELLQKSDPNIKIWSAASSTGQELYSLAMAWNDFWEGHPQQKKNASFLGTDIDFNSVDRARNAVYKNMDIETLNSKFLHKYFDMGSGSLKGFYRIKDSVHALCSFRQFNLMSSEYPKEKFDIIFLRNVLIYFKNEDVLKIIKNMEKCLKPDGYLFVGHSESLNLKDFNLISVHNSVYRLQGSSGVKEQIFSHESKSSNSLIRVFVIDDSKTIRAVLRKILTPEMGFEVIGDAENPIDAQRQMKGLSIDVITLDVHMPEMDGISYLESIKNQNHPPIVMLSSINYDDAVGALRCLELGAVDYIEKPKGLDLEAEAPRIRAVLANVSKIKTQMNSKFKSLKEAKPNHGNFNYQPSPDFYELIAIGSSTGGTEALAVVLRELPQSSPPVVVVQHIPARFSEALAKRLDELCKVSVCEAQDGMTLQPGHVYIAPGGRHMHLQQMGGTIQIKITDDEPENLHRPSVDRLFRSVAELKRVHVSAALLTGMGADGANQLKAIKNAGHHTIAQDEETSVVWGMPGKAVELGAAVEILPLPSIPYHLLKSFVERRK